MAHPYRAQAASTNKSKAHNMGKAGNLDIPIMRAVGENSSKKLYSSSSGSMQGKKESTASGYKRGGHVGKPKHSKPKIVIAAPAGPVNPSPPDPALAAAGAASSPAPAPMPPPGAGQPPMKRGGRTTGMRAGTDSGVGRLEQAHRRK